MLKKWTVGLLTLATLVGCCLLAGCGKAKEVPQPEINLSSPINSARAVDKGDQVYYLDNSGTLWVSRDGSAVQVAPLSAELIAIVGEDIWYADGSTLYVYSLSDGRSSLLCTMPSAIDSFSAYGDAIYCLSGSMLYNGDGSLLTDFSQTPSPDGVDLSTVERISMENSGELILYLPNPGYISEEGAEELPLRNDVSLTYVYSLADAKISAIDQFEADGALSNASPSSDSYVINGVALPFADYPVGSYFTQNGSACYCHAGDCVSNNRASENCIRYWPNKSNCQIDLRGVQCMGFARFCQWRLYGSIDFSNTAEFYNAFGKRLEAGSWTANTVKKTFTEVGPGGHIRTGAGHSLFVISVSASGFITYECNTNARDCKIYTRQWTWDSFFEYAGSRPLMYYNMPKDGNYSGQVTPPEDEYKVGTYQVAANGGLNLRTEANTSSIVLATIPQGSLINVSLVQKAGNYYWGYTEYYGFYGWVRLDYALYQNSTVKAIQITTPPEKVSYTVGDSFSLEGMVVEASFTNGAAFEIAGYTCSGYNMNKAGKYTVVVTYGSFTDSFEIEVKEKVIPPTSITLSDASVTLIVGDTYDLSYTILPKDTTQKGVTWTSSSPGAISINSGTVTAGAPGSATITITTENGLTATCLVTVINMPTGVNWSTTTSGQPLNELPLGIGAVDYSIRYRLPSGDGWGEWIYTAPPEDASGYQCQFRAFTATFIDTLDGTTVEQFTVEFNEVITLSKYSRSKNGYIFTGWYTDPQAAQAHDSSKACAPQITVTGDLLVYAGWISINDINADSADPFASSSQIPAFGISGIELRVSDDAPGIRFLGQISTDLIREIESLHPSNQALRPSSSTDSGIGFGMAVQIKDKLTSSLNKGNGTYLYDGKAVTVPAYNIYAEYNGYILFDAFVCGFSSDYYKVDFAARPYLTYADVNGTTHTYYFTASGDHAVGGAIYTNLYAEAEKLLANPTTTEATKQWLREYILG